MSDNTFQTKEFKENLHKYEVARQQGNSVYLEPEEFTDIAEYYHLHGRLADALDAINLALEIFPGATEPLAFRARVAILLGHNAEEAMQYANMIADKHDLEYYYIVAEILIADGHIDDAEHYLEKKEKEVDDDDLEDYYLDVATLFADYDVYHYAEQWLSFCQDTEENDYLELKGRIATSKGNYKQAQGIFNQLLDKDAYHTGYWNMLATTQYLENDVSKSLESSEFALAIDPDDLDALLNKANCLTMLGNFDEGMKYYQHYKRLQPQSEAGDMGIAAILMAQEKYEDSLRHWKSAEKLCPKQSLNCLDIYRNECFIYATINQLDDAFKCVDKLEQQAGASTPDTLVLRGYLHLLGGDEQDARNDFDNAYDKTPEEEKDNTLWFIAYCYFDANNMEEAHKLFRMLTESKSSKRFPDLWAYLVRTDYELGLQEEFLDDLKKATERNPYGIQRELSDIFPKGMSARDFYNYAINHPIKKR